MQILPRPKLSLIIFLFLKRKFFLGFRDNIQTRLGFFLFSKIVEISRKEGRKVNLNSMESRNVFDFIFQVNLIRESIANNNREKIKGEILFHPKGGRNLINRCFN